MPYRSETSGRYGDDRRIEIDNDAAELAVRCAAALRRNYALHVIMHSSSRSVCKTADASAITSRRIAHNVKDSEGTAAAGQEADIGRCWNLALLRQL